MTIRIQRVPINRQDDVGGFQFAASGSQAEHAADINPVVNVFGHFQELPHVGIQQGEYLESDLAKSFISVYIVIT